MGDRNLPLAVKYLKRMKSIALATALFFSICPPGAVLAQSIPSSLGWAHFVPPGPDPRVRVTEQYARLVVRDAYFWAWPMVNVHARRLLSEKLLEPGLLHGLFPVAPPNRLSMLYDFIDPPGRVAYPYNEDIYGGAVLALDISPVVIQVPDFGNHFWVYQVVDLRTDSFAQLGKMYGTTPGFYMLVGPKWQGDIPRGITKIFRASSNTGIVIPHVFQNDAPKDKAAVHSLVQGIDLYPVAEYDGKLKRRDWRKLARLSVPGEGADDRELRWVSHDTFLDELHSVLADAPPLPGEEARYAQILSVIAAAQNDSKLKTAMIDETSKAENEMIVPLRQFQSFGISLPHNWNTISNGANFGTDYFTRTAVAVSNIFVTSPTEMKYFYQDFDTRGERLDGANRYTMTFAKDRLPPVNGLWSLMVYDENHLLVANALKRYSLGTNTKALKHNSDGSLTIYIQADPPLDLRRSNWLPATKSGHFSLYIRAYWPKPEIVDHSWTPPGVEMTVAIDKAPGGLAKSGQVSRAP
jgi:hypothetical protein